LNLFPLRPDQVLKRADAPGSQLLETNMTNLNLIPPLPAITTRRSHHPSAARSLGISAIALALFVGGASVANAQQLLSPGDAVVSGFSGIKPSGDGADVRIDLNGPSAQILPLAQLPGAPSGQMTVAPAKRIFKAEEIGQVFAIALDDAGNIYLGATSAFGLNIVEGSGNERLEAGEPGARFMDGQFGKNGGPGSIWRVDGTTGEITEFAKLPDNAGPGIGDIVFDTVTRQFFVSDLDTGLIHRLSAAGELIDTFDHGTTALPATGGEPIEDDGQQLDIASPDFVTTSVASWGFTQAERRIWGMAVRDGRLYYAVAGTNEVWSVGITETGEYSADAKRELTVDGLPSDGPITDMVFDSSGRMYLSQRAEAEPTFNFTRFTKPQKATVVRYRRAEDGVTWEPDPDSYAIGMPADHIAANGGIALGYDYSEGGNARRTTCGQFLWSTGERLVASDTEAPDTFDVHGLQGNKTSAVRPANTPPSDSYFVDYDGFVGDNEKAGHLGDVEVYQPCGQTEASAPPVTGTPPLPPGFVPPGTVIPPELPPDFPPPTVDFSANLELIKRTTTPTCLPAGGGWFCGFRVRVRNTGPDNYFGDIQIRDALPGNPAGAFFGVGPVPPWSCWMSGPAALQCWRPNVFLTPGQSVVLNVNVWVPNSYDRCRLRNRAEIEWAPGGTRWNTDPSDDADGASATLPLERCQPLHQPVGSVVHRPAGSRVHRPRGSEVHRPRGSDVHRPRGSIVHRPRGSDVHRPRGSIVHRPRGRGGSIVHSIHRPRGSDVHRPRGSIVHRPRGSIVHRPRGSKIHRPRGSKIVRAARPPATRAHSKIHRPRGSRIHRPRGSKIHPAHTDRASTGRAVRRSTGPADRASIGRAVRGSTGRGYLTRHSARFRAARSFDRKLTRPHRGRVSRFWLEPFRSSARPIYRASCKTEHD
jgi:hypothetical protein